jgi:hypothetical protein
VKRSPPGNDQGVTLAISWALYAALLVALGVVLLQRHR